MRGTRFLPTLALVILAGCFANKAAVDPYSYAPQKQDSLWRHKPQKELLVYDVSGGPLSLAEILDIALKNNPDTKISWAKARIAAAQYGQAQSPDLPTVNTNYTYSRSRYVDAAVPDLDPSISAQKYFLSQWGPQLTLSYTLLDFGQTRAAANAAKEALYQANYMHNRQIQNVVQSVTNEYYAYLYQVELLKADEQDLMTAQTTFKAAQVGLDAGVKNLSDVLQAQTQLLQNQIQLVTQKQNVVQAFASLLTSMGIQANQKLEVQQYPNVPPLEEMLQNAEELLATAMGTRDDLLAAQAHLESQKESVLATQQQFFPTLAYNLNFGQTSYTLIGSDRYDFTTSFSLNFPLFSGFSTLNSLKAAKAKQTEAEALLVKTQLQIVEEITVSHSAVKTAYETVNYSKDFLEAARVQYDVALARYKAGTADILEVVSAQASLANARAQNASSINNWFSSLINLSYAAGTLSPPPPRKPLCVD